MAKLTLDRRHLIVLSALVIVMLAGSVLVAVLLYSHRRQRQLRDRLTVTARRLPNRPLPFTPEAPKTIRVLRTKLPFLAHICVDSYRGRCIQEMDFERYIVGVVSAEEGVFLNEARKRGALARQRVKAAWQIQAIAARSYALYCLIADKYDVASTGFHITDTPRDQAYQSRHYAEVADAVAQTAGKVLVDRTAARLIYAEYSASCHGRGTRSIVAPRRHIPCHRQCRRYSFSGSSHHRGLCQWGSFLFALEGRDLTWLREHYYPRAKLITLRPRAPKKLQTAALPRH